MSYTSKRRNWNPKAEEAFKKKHFTTALVLSVPDPALQFLVEVDASNEGVRAVLSQRLANDRFHRCAFLSRKLTPAERNYDVVGSGSRSHSQMRCLTCMSREPTAKEPETILSPDRVVGAVTWQIEKDVQRASRGETAPEGCPRNRLFVLEALHSKVIHWAHTSLLICHPGVKRTKFVIEQQFWWLLVAKDVAEYVSACSVCARGKGVKAGRSRWGSSSHYRVPHCPWSHISLDFISGLPLSKGNTTVLTVVDRFYRAPESRTGDMPEVPGVSKSDDVE
ncbi:hypothetical protein L3Q82_023557 [Scortum barcoo]|uniref:Uncharacterized protein n=1 Tax=Scortum barcoo TaxID=214431 RepID=A0ACB8WUG6_9TELE|nr:hypothetical protein L3Q82_023557 [Scortum barcoo]